MKSQWCEALSYELVEKELSRPTIFKDESKLFPDYVPVNLVHREEQLRKLASTFKVLIESPGAVSQKAILIGSVGAGKTAVSKRFGLLAEEAARKRGIPLKYVHINCHRDRTLFLIVKKIAQLVLPSLPERGFSAQELFQAIWNTLEESGQYLLLALDEVDFLVSASGEEPLYFLTRLADEHLNRPQRISLILIAREPLFQLLDDSTRSTLLHNVIKFEKYTADQLYDIVRLRAEEAFVGGAVPDETLMLISDIAGKKGDARYALELLWRAGKCADYESSKLVMPHHVRKAQSDVSPGFSTTVLRDIPKHEKLVLLAIAKALKKRRSAYVTMGDVESTYKLLCEENGEEPRKHTQFWEYVQNLRSLGFISTRLSGSGFRGKTTLIGLVEFSVESIEKELSNIGEAS